MTARWIFSGSDVDNEHIFLAGGFSRHSSPFGHALLKVRAGKARGKSGQSGSLLCVAFR
jgi:hypothetical protein